MAGEDTSPTPEPTPQERFIEEHELIDTGFDDELDAPPTRQTPAVPEPPPPAVSSKPKHSKRVLRMAADLGITQEEIDTTDPESLDQMVYYMNRQALAVAAQNRRDSNVQNQPAPSAQPAAPPAEDEFDFGFSQELNRKITEADYDPGLMKVLKAQAKELKELRSHAANVQQREVQRTQMTAADMLDEAFEALGPAYEKIVGKGAAREMGDSAEYKRRVAVLLSSGIKDIGEVPGMTRKQLQAKVKEAAETLFMPVAAEPEPEPPAPAPKPKPKTAGRFTPEEWAAAGVARPTQRTTTEPKGEKRAMKAVAALQREQGVDGDDYTSGVEEAGLPD